jgi:hypothetical protein
MAVSIQSEAYYERATITITAENAEIAEKRYLCELRELRGDAS